jgi:hypothetical protein
MPYPTPIVEIAFTDGPYVVSPTWTDVTSYVRSMDISRGVPDDWTLQADGSATVVLSNRDRRFDPFNASGPHFGNLLPRRQIRIRATSGATTYDVFRGFISGWPPEWTDAGYDSTVTLSCFDALQLLGSSSLPANWALPYIQSLSPRHYWPMDDPISFYQQSDFVLRDLGSVTSNLVYQSATAYPDSPIASGVPAGSIGSENNFNGAAIQSTSTVSATANSDFTICFWTKATPQSFFQAQIANRTIQFFQNQNSTVGDYEKFRLEIVDNAGNQYSVLTDNSYDSSVPHHIAFTYNSSTNARQIYIDGIVVAQTILTGTTVGIFPTVEIFSFGRGSFQEAAVFHSILTSTQINNIVRFSEATFLESVSARISRIITETPFSSSLVSTPASPASDVIDISPGSVTAVSELTRVSESEYAPLFVNKAGTITQYSQNQIRTQTKSIVSQATYGSGGLPIGTDIELRYDGDSMRNLANIEVSGKGTYVQTNTSSVNTYGEAEQLVSTQVSTLADAKDIANIVTGWGGNVYAKASPVQVVLSPNESWGSTLGLELFDRFTLAVAPRTGSTITTPMLLSRISHSVTPERWSTTVEGSARWAAVFILNTSTLGGTDLLG